MSDCALLRTIALELRITCFPSTLNKLRNFPVNFNSLHTTSQGLQRANKTRPSKSIGGRVARTSPPIQVKYSDESNISSGCPVLERGGLKFNRILPLFSLKGKVGLVTGGAGGLGVVMSQALAMSGADVAIVDLEKEVAAKKAEEIVAFLIRENPDGEKIPKITAHYADVSSKESVDNAITEVIQQHGKIDNLVTSAGFTENFEAINYPIDRLRKLWQVNVDGTYLFAVATAKHLMKRKSSGSIIFIASMSGSIVNIPQPQAPYNASKAAVKHLASSLAVEWAQAGIRVNCISPGYMLTALTKKILNENPDLEKKWMSLIPQRRMGNPEDLMGTIVFLASDASNYITGTEIRVDGGYTLI